MAGEELVLFAVLIQIPAVRETFGIRMPNWSDMAMALAVSALVVFAIEMTKAYLRATMGRTSLPVTPVPRIAESVANPVPSPQQFVGGNTMLKVLVPVDGSRNCQFAVKHVIKEFMNNKAMEIHFLNVQPPFSSYMVRFVSRKALHDYQCDETEKALRPIRQMLDSFAIPYSVHTEVGDRAQCIIGTARRLRCDRIVMSTGRKNSLARLVENSVTNKVIELTSVPVEVIAGDAIARWERCGIRAGLGVLLALMLAAFAA